MIDGHNRLDKPEVISGSASVLGILTTLWSNSSICCQKRESFAPRSNKRDHTSIDLKSMSLNECLAGKDSAISMSEGEASESPLLASYMIRTRAYVPYRKVQETRSSDE